MSNKDPLHTAIQRAKRAALRTPSSAEAWGQYGRALLALAMETDDPHLTSESVKKLRHALSLSATPDSALHWDYGRALALLAAHSSEAIDLRLAQQAFQTAMQIMDIIPAELYYDLGESYVQMGLMINKNEEYFQAIEQLKQTIERAPKHVEAHYSLANCFAFLFLNTQDTEFASKSDELYNRLTQLEPKNPDYWQAWGELLGEGGRVFKSKELLARSIETCAWAFKLDPESVHSMAQMIESIAELGVIAEELQLLTKAEEISLNTVEKWPDVPAVWHACGSAYLALARYFDDLDLYMIAIDKLQQGLSLDRTDAELWHTQASAHFEMIERTSDTAMIERMLRFFHHALELKPAYPPLMYDTAMAHMLTFSLTGLEDHLTNAIELFEPRAHLTQYPSWRFQYALALFHRANVTGEPENLLRATEILREIAQDYPEYQNIELHQAICFSRLGEFINQPSHYVEAERHFQRATNPELSELWLEWGLNDLLYSEHLVDPHEIASTMIRAEEKWRRAQTLGHPEAYYYLACLYSIQKRIDLSLFFLDKAFEFQALPSIDELCEEEWLENVRQTESFALFIERLEARQ